MRGLHPLIVELVIVAVTMAIAVAAAAWVMGVYRSAQGRAEAVLRIYNATLYLNPDGSCTLTALFKAEGGEVEVVKVWAEPLRVIVNYTLTPTPKDGLLMPGVIYQFKATFSRCSLGGSSFGEDMG